jgi:glycosyltransferase involved in cell wall biosynthesis
MDCFRISVIVPCHNYGRYLAQCLTSILEQTRRPDEIVVVDDSSQDTTREVALQFASKGVRYIRAEFNDPLATRRLGASVSSGEILCFIDADDYIDATYLESGIRHFSQRSDVGIVYSDVEYCGWITGREVSPPDTRGLDIHQVNFIHAGALVRRHALELADAFSQHGPANRHEDWRMWRAIIEVGFTGVRQSGIYFYRKHDHNLSSQRVAGKNGYDYYTGADLSSEAVSLFTTLSGRIDAWEQFRSFLERQLWNHARTPLILFDCSGSEAFSRTVRQWLGSCDYPTIQYVSLPNFLGGWTPAGSAWESDRRLMRDRWLQNGKIIAELRQRVRTHYLWIVEEDILPPSDTCEQLLRLFAYDTVSVTAVCPRSHDSVFAWQAPEAYLGEGASSETVGGNSFGCAIVRSPILGKAIISDLNRDRPVEMQIYDNLGPNQISRIHWGVRCERPLPLPPPPVARPMTADTFDEKFYLDCYRDVAYAVYSRLFVSGYAHYIKHGIAEGRLARVKALSDINNKGSAR